MKSLNELESLDWFALSCATLGTLCSIVMILEGNYTGIPLIAINAVTIHMTFSK
jgi:hypothetical protein